VLSFHEVLVNWTLWPNLNESQEDLNILVETFYQHVLDEDVPVFYRKDLHEVTAVTSSLSNSTFLEPIIRNQKDINILSFQLLLSFVLLSLLKRTKLFLSFSTIKHPFICNGNMVSTGSKLLTLNFNEQAKYIHGLYHGEQVITHLVWPGN
jgi:hypothetical protein